MLYHISACWKSERYFSEFCFGAPRPRDKYNSLRDERLQNGLALPELFDWSFVSERGHLEEHWISADCLWVLSKEELTGRLAQHLVPNYADRIEVDQSERDFTRLVSLN